MSVDAIGGYEDDDFLVRSAQVPYSAMNVGPVYVPLKDTSSVAIADHSLSPQQSPKLSPPNVTLSMWNVLAEAERLTGKSAMLFEKEKEQKLADLERLSAERLEALENEAKASKSRDTWSALSNISQYISSVGLIAVGSACGGIPAALLIGSGVIGVGNRVLHDTNLLQAGVSWWTKSIELQEKYTRNIEMGAFFLQLGLGLSGGLWAIQAGSFAAAHSATFLGITQKTAATITTASAIAGTGTKLGSEIYKKRIADLRAQMTEISAETTDANQTLTRDTIELAKGLDLPANIGQEIGKTIQTLQITID